MDPEKPRRPRDCVVKAAEVIWESEAGGEEVEVPPLGRRGLVRGQCCEQPQTLSETCPGFL